MHRKLTLKEKHDFFSNESLERSFIPDEMVEALIGTKYEKRIRRLQKDLEWFDDLLTEFSDELYKIMSKDRKLVISSFLTKEDAEHWLVENIEPSFGKGTKIEDLEIAIIKDEDLGW